MPTTTPVKRYIVDTLPVQANRTVHSIYYVKDINEPQRCKAFVIGATPDVVREVARPEMAVDINNTPAHDALIAYSENTFVTHAGGLYFNPVAEGPSAFSAPKWAAVDPGKPWLLSHVMALNQAVKHARGDGSNWVEISGWKVEAKNEGAGRSVEMNASDFRFTHNGVMRRQIGQNFETLRTGVSLTAIDGARPYAFTNLDVQVSWADLTRYNAALIPGSLITKQYLESRLPSLPSDEFDPTLDYVAGSTVAEAGKVYTNLSNWTAAAFSVGDPNAPAWVEIDPSKGWLNTYNMEDGHGIITHAGTKVGYFAGGVMQHTDGTRHVYRDATTTIYHVNGVHAKELSGADMVYRSHQSIRGDGGVFQVEHEGLDLTIKAADLARYDAATTARSLITKSFLDDNTITPDIFKSYGHQLVRNFNGYTADNSNFKRFSFSKEFGPDVGAPGTFSKTHYSSRLVDDLIPVNTRRKYIMSFDVRMSGSGWAGKSPFYVYLDFYDADKQVISSHTAKRHSERVNVTQAVSAGDTVIHTEPVTLIEATYSTYRSLNVYPYKSGAAVYVNSDYSRFKFAPDDAYAAVIQIDWEATRAANGGNLVGVTAIHFNQGAPANCPLIGMPITGLERAQVAQGSIGGTYLYVNAKTIANPNTNLPFSSIYQLAADSTQYVDKWFHVEVVIEGTQSWIPGAFTQGTAFVRPSALLNYSPDSANKTTHIANVMLEAIVPAV